jgi:uncharacterized membrane protein YczE
MPSRPVAIGPRTVLQAAPRLLGGLFLCATGIALMVVADLGLGPWDVLHQGLSLLLDVSIGAATIGTGVAVLLVWLPLRERPGLGTVANVAFIGLFLDLVLTVLPVPETAWLRWTMLLAGVPIFAIGSGFYLGVGLGPGPRDGVMTGLARRGLPLGVARAAIELTVLTLGWLLGGTVGFGTVYFALAIGPLVHVLVPFLRAPWFPPGAQPRVLGGTPR